MKTFKYIVVGLVAGIMFGAGIANAVTVTLPQNPKTGTLLVGSSTTAYRNMATGTPGYVLTATNTPPYILWEAAPGSSGAFTTTTLTAAGTTISQTAYTLATSGPALAISCAVGTCTWSLSTSTASQTGVLSSADWTTFNSKQAPYWSKTGTNIYLTTSTDFVGIGTTTPATALHVLGDVTVSGTSTVGKLKLTGLSNTNQIYFNSIGTGMHSSGPDILDIDTGGVTRINIDSVGDVSIGTSTTGSDTLGVSSNTAGPIFQTYTSSTHASAFIVANNGNVGIGTTTPATALHVVGVGTFDQVGIGTTTPFNALHVVGGATITGNLTLGVSQSGILKRTVGAVGTAIAGTDYQAPISTASTSSLALNGNVLYNNGVTSINSGTGAYGILAGANIVVASTTTSTTVSVTSTPSSITSITYADSTKQSTAYKDTGFNATRASSTTDVGASSTIQRIYYKAMTMVQVDCSTDGASITIQSDYRASSTPQTYGTSTFTGLVCPSTGASTTTFSNANIPANSILNFWISSVANSTTTLRVSYRLKEQ